jgi:hypothetical protein
VPRDIDAMPPRRFFIAAEDAVELLVWPLICQRQELSVYGGQRVRFRWREDGIIVEIMGRTVGESS